MLNGDGELGNLLQRLRQDEVDRRDVGALTRHVALLRRCLSETAKHVGNGVGRNTCEVSASVVGQDRLDGLREPRVVTCPSAARRLSSRFSARARQ